MINMQPKKYERPELTEEEKKKIIKWSNLLICTKGRQGAIAATISIISENVRLLKEVNEHRQTLGIEPLPVLEPKI